MHDDSHRLELIYFFRERASEGVFDVYTDQDRDRIDLILDDIHFPRNETARVLDCGCGTGRLTVLLAERLGEGSSVTGLDITPEMIDRARQIRRAPGGRTIDFRVGDCHNLPFDNEAFDWVVVLESFPHFCDPRGAVSEFYRVLKDGGRVAILDRRPSSETNKHHREIGGVVADDSMPDMITFLAVMKDAGFWVQVYVDDDDGFRLLAVK